MTTLPQASPGASVPTPEGSPLSHGASLRGRRQRRRHARRPRGPGGRESTRGTPGRRRLGDESEGPSARAVAQNQVPGTPGCRLHPCPHLGPGVKGDPAPASPRGAFLEGGANKKLRKVGDEPWAPLSAHLAPQRPGGSRSESAHRGLHGIWAAGPAPASAPPRTARPRPPGAPGPIRPAPRWGPRLGGSGSSGQRAAGERRVRARRLGGPGALAPRLRRSQSPGRALSSQVGKLRPRESPCPAPQRAGLGGRAPSRASRGRPGRAPTGAQRRPGLPARRPAFPLHQPVPRPNLAARAWQMGTTGSDSQDAEGRNAGREDGARRPGSALDPRASARRRVITSVCVWGGSIKGSPCSELRGSAPLPKP